MFAARIIFVHVHVGVICTLKCKQNELMEHFTILYYQERQLEEEKRRRLERVEQARLARLEAARLRAAKSAEQLRRRTTAVDEC